jgi:hypothetical protein
VPVRPSTHLRPWRPLVLLVALVGVGASACAPEPPSSTAVRTAPAGGVWLSPGEVARLPTAGAAWERVRAAAADLGRAEIADQDSDHDVRTLAAALVAARTGDQGRRRATATAVVSAIGTEAGGRTLALARNLVPYVVAADLIDLRHLDPGADRRFRAWLARVRHERLEGSTLVDTHLQRPNNWGTHAGAALAAVAAYLGDRAELARVATVLRGWLGERSAYDGFDYGDTSWQADPRRPVGVNPVGARREGRNVDGALPEELRRGCAFQWEPCRTGYTWGALQGAVVTAQILSRQGFEAWAWQGRALLRAVRFHVRVDRSFGGWWAEGDDAWVVLLVNRAYGAAYPVPAEVGLGKNMGFTDYTHA